MYAGPALALLPLVFAQDRVSVLEAVACLTAAVGLQGFCYAGYHAYVQVRHPSQSDCELAACDGNLSEIENCGVQRAAGNSAAVSHARGSRPIQSPLCGLVMTANRRIASVSYQNQMVVIRMV